MEYIYKEKDLSNIVKQLIEKSNSKTLAFYAPMGAGKTTLIKAFIKELGSKDNVSSPTFGLVNEYALENGELLAYHFDFYRLEDEVEAMDMGIDDYLTSDSWIFMEWPEKIPNLIPKDVQEITIEILDESTRRLKLS
ncbi:MULTISPECIES: tRNA (adenosine(37)-N6)-threonylcarbamoyltransferase complex ATPase subunit type 1 TsaE [Maribacter]|uniref:tRNA (adenosine(37)-N6)-threonylcarbamoyltransferase complex ATPase subunit type 1 TsaE n=1 Tax=Maribacter TaxID=252356 RepID=UPI00047BD70B|nr:MULTISPECIES: tRNA (adenosine(37)-N6)-threonylcarbamoyltransferase complex ATPase subunit type 1 TsaE [Maribacter]|tara:strand:- start:3598 stop:4008 length:411 start_codon:yes stop_codon:yes gene_type:complete|eukprot:TRINITY_DN8207_c0_g1_i5.p2 TRINITY_DN8207_c0_g1~~TRINITY_DN8207_c0_g1_i5.p2  ORF type:complete len:137 (+),score=33.03 TRINITY_DN8207_c0_g1_i5:466-876(+)